MNLIKNILIASSLMILIISCSKEEDEIPLSSPNVSSADFDAGYLGIILQGANTMLDSITYTNTTKDYSINVIPQQIIFAQGDTIGYYFKPLRNGNNGDNVKCCVYVNTPTSLEIVFNDSVIVDTSYTIQFNSVGVGTYCISGTY